MIFIIAILLPSLILSYMGLQSIRQEQSRQEEIFVKNLEQLLAIAASRVETEVEDRLHTLMNSLPVSGYPRSRSFFQQLRQVIHHSPLADDVFMLDMNLNIIHPRRYHQAPAVQHLSHYNQVDFQQGETYEARENFQDAVDQYRQGLQTSGSVLESLALLNGIARCQMKMNQLAEARGSFREIIQRDRGRFLGGEVPFVLLAYHQLADIESTLRPGTAAMNVMLDFYEFLVDHFGHLRAEQHSFYIAGIKQKIEGSLSAASGSQQGRYALIGAREKAAEAERAFRVFFDHYLLPVCRNFILLPEDRFRLKFFRLLIEQDHCLIAMRVIPGETDTQVLQGIVLNQDAVTRLLVSAVASYNTQDEFSLFLIPPGGAPGSEDHPSIGRAGLTSLADLLPHYSLGINLLDYPAFSNINNRSIRLYYSLFAAIIGVILLGIVFIIRDLSRERQFTQLRTSFIANASHEIKTPIATIRVLAGNLSEGFIVRQERQKHYFRLITREAERLSYLTENILDFSSLEAHGKVYSKEMLNLHDLLQKILARFCLMHQQGDLDIQHNIPSGLPDILASPRGIEQVVLNLLDNAAKYSGPQKSICLSLEQDAGQAVISVSDEGLGIAQSEQIKIFDKFYRVEHNGQNNIPGSGIGLSLVKEIARMHHGRIELKSEPGKGSTFSLIIPVNHAKDTID